MSASQQHGLEIERRIKQEFQRLNTGWLPAHLSIDPAHTARFDVPGYVDPYGQGIPTSIKSAKLRNGKALICMSDATRIADLASFETTRLLVALYEQEGSQKVFREVREYLITGEEWKTLTGGVPADVLASFHEAIKLESATKARAVARKWKARLATDYPDTPMRWNPKIGSGNQRRLQCSLHLADLEHAVQDPSRIKVFGAPKDPPGRPRPPHLRAESRHLWGNGLRLPIVLDSPPRVRYTKKKPPSKAKPSPSPKPPSARAKAPRGMKL